VVTATADASVAFSSLGFMAQMNGMEFCVLLIAQK